MLCSYCGNSGLTPGGTCPACGKAQTTARTVAASTLTPPPPENAQLTPLPTGLSSAEVETQLDSTGRSGIPAATGTLPLGEPFGRRYRILKVLGQGGMGVVYQAWDEELGLAVALKTIRPEVMSDPITAADVERRFKRELLLARQVTHRHVVRIHDLGEVDGVKYLTMPFIEGQTLSSVLSQSGKLPCGRALQIIRQISDGLLAAHGVGVVHRDLKPENVMLDGDGHAVIMDFGISRSLTGTGAGTMMGSVVGTLEYMSPEQARGETADQRSDIYALGLMLYDMLVGRRRFAVGTSPLSEAMSRMTHAPPPVRSLEAAVPDPVERIVNRCLEPDAGKRYQTVAELIADLDRLEPDGHERPLPSKPRIVPEFAASWPKPAQFALLAALALLALAPLAMIAIMVNSMRQAPAAPAAARAPLSILIADFQNLANDPVFDGSLEQVLAIAMEGAPFITTFPRRDALTAARAAQGSPIDRLDVETARLVSQREGIKVVLAGSVASEGRGYRVDVRAVDAFKGEALANASRSASSKENVLQAMAAVASDVREALGDVTPESERLAQAETFTSGKLDAAREYGIAQQLSSNGKYQESIQHYKRATEIDPDFGRAYATWAVSEFTLGRPKEAEELYKKAFTLLNRMTKREEHRTVGTYYLSVAKDYDKAVENFSTLVREYPADRAGHSNLALSYFYTRNFAKALEHGHRATEIYGTSPKFRSNNALYAMYAGDFATAAAESKKVLAEQPDYRDAYLSIAMEAVSKDDLAAAAKAYDDMAAGSGGRSASVASLGRADLALYTGRLDAAAAELRTGITADLAAQSTTDAALKHIALAEAELGAGRRPQAVDAAREALKLSKTLSTIVPAARVFLHAGRAADARALATELEAQLQKQNRAYAKIVLAEIALEEKQAVQATDLLMQARALSDVWLGRFDLGVAYVQAGHFAEAMTEFEACEKRRGEATALFFDDRPTVRYLAPLPYWMGRAQEGLGMIAPAKTRYEAFLNLRKDATTDPLADDARRRVGGR